MIVTFGSIIHLMSLRVPSDGNISSPAVAHCLARNSNQRRANCSQNSR
jgi:hypothetical protein